MAYLWQKIGTFVRYWPAHGYQKHDPERAITGFRFGGKSAKEQFLAGTMLCLRCQTELATPSIGQPNLVPYVVDTCLEGEDNQQRSFLPYHADISCKTKIYQQQGSVPPWRRGLHSIRQLVETIYANLIKVFRLNR